MVYPGERNSYLFGDSKIDGELTFELPLEFRINNLQFADTLDNFLNKSEDQGDNYNPDNNNQEDNGSSISDMLEKVILKLEVDNGFPLGLTASIILHDTFDKYRLIHPRSFRTD